jgi:hypothetical protein
MKMKMRMMGLMGIMAASALAFSGCVTQQKVTSEQDPYDPNVTRLITNSVTTLDTNMTLAAINVAVPGTVRLVCAKDENARAYFLQAALVLNAAASGGQYDVATITNSLAKISIRELRSQNAVIAEEAALAIYKAFFAEVVSKQLDREVWLKPVLLALAEAVKSGATP